MNSPAIGIHFGSSYSCVGVYQFGKVEIIANDQGSRITPSYVAFTDNGTLIGEAAENQSKSNPKNTIYDVQKMLGCKYNDVHSLASVKHWPFQITEHYEKPQIKVKFSGSFKKYFPEEISSVIIGKMKETAEAYLAKTIRNAVITVPAYFNDSQRAATIDAAKFAGLNLLSIIDEPIAAAIAYGLEQKLSPLKVLVLDMEGGNFNVSVLALENNVFKVISNIHKAYLDIDKYDKRMVNYFAQDFKDTYNKKPTNNKKASSRLLAACKRARGILISSPVANIDIESFHDGIDYHTRIYRAFFEELNDDFFRRAMVVINKAIQDAAIDKTDIEHVVLIGTSSRMPKIQKMLQNFLGEKEFNMSIHPNETVAYGAALQASILNIDESKFKEEQNAVLTDCAPLSLGVNAKYDEMAVIVKRRTPIPARQTAVFDIKEVHQSCFRFGVYEGEYPAVKLNHYLGQVELSGIHHAPVGDSSAYITFEIDANCTLKVTAVQTWTGSVSQLSVKYDRNRLSCFEVNRMISGAEKYRVKQQEEERNAALSAKNALKSCCSKLVDKVLNFERDLILNKCEDTILWLNSHQSAEKELYKCKQKELENVSDAMDGFINQVKIMLFNSATSLSQRRPCRPFLTNQITITHDEGLRSKDKVEQISKDAGKCRDEENIKQKDIFTAKNSLLLYCIEVMSTVKDEKSNIDKFNRDVMLKKCNEAIHWLNQNHSVEKELYESKLEDLKTRFDAVNSTAKIRRKENDKHEALNACFSKRYQKSKPSEMASKCNRGSSEGKTIDFDSDD